MLPLALNAGALTTRMTGLARSASPLLGAATARVRALGITIGDKAEDLIAWAKLNPGNAAIAALTLGSLGLTVADLFVGEEGQKIATLVANGSLGLADAAKIMKAGESSMSMNLNIAENAADVYTAREVLRFARAHYGSDRGAVRAHKLHQAFFEMPLDDVEVGFDTIKL